MPHQPTALLLAAVSTLCLVSNAAAQPAEAAPESPKPIVEDSGDAASAEKPSPREVAEPQPDTGHEREEATFTESELRPQDYDEGDSGKRPADAARRLDHPEGTEPEDIYLFFPRAALFLPRLALHTVFMPIRGAATLIDKYHVIEHVKEVLYNDEETAGVVPTVGYQSDYGFTGGAKAFHDDLLGNEESASISAEYGGFYLQAYKFKFEGDRVARTPLWLEAAARYEQKPGLLFWGIGNQSLSAAAPGTDIDPRAAAVETRFREERFGASALVGETVKQRDQWAQVGVMGIYNHRQFGRRTRQFSEPSLEDVYDTDQLVGYESGVDVLELGPVFIFDSRDHEVLTSSGTYLDCFGSYAMSLPQQAGYWHYGVTVAGFIDLYKRSRVLSLRAVLEAVHGDDRDIPFTELMRLGGPERLRGYEPDRFRDKISFVATAEYRYPVHDLVAGEVFVEAGRVGPAYSDTFALSNSDPIRGSGGLGLVFHDREKLLLKAQAAYGESFTLFISSNPLDLFSERHKRL